jgi:hypothetical protein
LRWARRPDFALNPPQQPAIPPSNLQRQQIHPPAHLSQKSRTEVKDFLSDNAMSGYLLDDRRMVMGNDAQLLQDYLAGGSEPAFTWM